MAGECCNCLEVAQEVVTVFEKGPAGSQGVQGDQGIQGNAGATTTTPGGVTEDLQTGSYVVTDVYTLIPGLSILLTDPSKAYMAWFAGSFKFTNGFARLELKYTIDGMDIANSERFYGGADSTGPGIPVDFQIPITLQSKATDPIPTGLLEVEAKITTTGQGGIITEGIIHILEVLRD